MRRYWLQPEALSSDRAMVTIAGDELHHIRDVCRQRTGDRFEVLIDGRALLVEITDESKRESQAKVLSERVIEPLPYPRVRLVLAVPRFPVFEAVIEKCVELGVEAVHPVYSQNSFIRTNESAWQGKQTRFAKIIQSATQQCGRGELMRLEPAEKLEALMAREFGQESANRVAAAKGLFAYEGGGSSEPMLVAKNAVRALAAGPQEQKTCWVFVGGEGGFSSGEVELFRGHGLQPTTLGRQVLRVETACVALISVLKYELDLMR